MCTWSPSGYRPTSFARKRVADHVDDVLSRIRLNTCHQNGHQHELRCHRQAGLFGQDGIDRVLVVRFSPSFASMEPDEFIRDVIIDGLDARTIVVGDDFRFGRRGAGDFSLLLDFAARSSIDVARRDSFEIDGQRVSSSAIRESLSSGDLETAERFLGRKYSIQGRVAYGRQLGRTIGFPTANVRLNRANPPISGVFAVKVYRLGHDDALPVWLMWEDVLPSMVRAA